MNRRGFLRILGLGAVAVPAAAAARAIESVLPAESLVQGAPIWLPAKIESSFGRIPLGQTINPTVLRIRVSGIDNLKKLNAKLSAMVLQDGRGSH